MYFIYMWIPIPFLQQQHLQSEEEGKEELILHLLLNVSAHCGICFPCTPSSSSSLHAQPTATCTPLLHTVTDDVSLEVKRRKFFGPVTP